MAARPISRIAVISVAAAALLLGLSNITVALKADDVWSRNAVMQSWLSLLDALTKDVHPPVYFLLLKPVVGALGDSEPALRLLSVLCFWMACGAMYRLARRFHEPATALVATAAFVAAPLATQTAELVRMYSLLVLLAILSTTALVDLTRKPSARLYACFAALTAIGTFTHLWYFCLIAGQGLALVVLARARVFRIGAALLAGVLPYLVLWLPVLLGQLDTSKEAAAWLPPPRLDLIPNLAYLWLGTGLLLVPWAAFQNRRSRQEPWPREALLWPALLLAGTIVPPLAVSFVKPFFYSRFTIVAVPFVALLAGPWFARAAGQQAAVALALMASLVGLGLKAGPDPCTGRKAAAHLLANARPGDFVFYSGLGRPATRHYLDQQRPERGWHEQTFPAEIDTHPGYEGSVKDPARVPAFEAEARAIADRVRQSPPGTRVFYLEGRHPAVESILIRELERFTEPAPARAMGCPAEAGGYYRQITSREVSGR